MVETSSPHFISASNATDANNAPFVVTKFINEAGNGGSTATNLATWLATNLPHLFGVDAGANNLTGKTNSDVAALFQKLNSSKGDAEVMAAALAVYVTDSDLAGTAATASKFNVSTTGTGAKTFNVGNSGTAIGLSNNTSYTVLALIQQAYAQKGAGTFTANAFGDVFHAINDKGGIG